MVAAGSVQADRIAVRSRGITLVLLPLIHREFFVKALHIVVAICFSQDGSGRDTEVFSVSLYDSSVGDRIDRLEAIAVDDDVLRDGRELPDALLHRADRRVQDVDFVYDSLIEMCYGKRKCTTFDDRTQLIPLFLRQLFGVVQELMPEIGRKDDSGGGNGAGKASATGFVGTGFKFEIGIGGEEHRETKSKGTEMPYLIGGVKNFLFLI